MDGSGNLLVADAYNHRIQKLDPDGRAVHIWGSFWKRLFRRPLGFNVPTGVAVDSRGHVHVADSARGRVVILQVTGE
ncbi:MAG: hypothetical protein HY548_01760 [Elusimicrobia bacterium]|nr:hypothetical protein [Elusimicrobiota bacterium]